jgi:hypothetical protein
MTAGVPAAALVWTGLESFPVTREHRSMNAALPTGVVCTAVLSGTQCLTCGTSAVKEPSGRPPPGQYDANADRLGSKATNDRGAFLAARLAAPETLGSPLNTHQWSASLVPNCG